MAMLTWNDGEHDRALDYLEGNFWAPNSDEPGEDSDSQPFERTLEECPTDEDGYEEEEPEGDAHNSRVAQCACSNCWRQARE